MHTRGWRAAGLAAAFAAWLLRAGAGWAAAAPPESQSRVQAALENIAALDRPGEDGLATVWDGNKYVQCRRMRDRTLRCEAAGELLQPSLGRVLVPERVARLVALGWHLDPSFGNYVQIFPQDVPVAQVAERILEALAEGYDADLANLEVRTDWIANQPCPPRNGYTQNLAGMINDAPAVASTAIRGCAYTPPATPSIRSAADLIGVYGTRATAEIQRLRINSDRRVFVVFETGGGYVQCEPETSPAAIYCEAQSAESWEMLANVLTSERVARLHAAGYADPGRAPNYWRTYPLADFDDAVIARELLTILYDVYGYKGSPRLKFKTEKSPP
jgi:hypothetical protein